MKFVQYFNFNVMDIIFGSFFDFPYGFLAVEKYNTFSIVELSQKIGQKTTFRLQLKIIILETGSFYQIFI